MRDWERMSITDGIWAGIRACVEARSTDEPRRMMEAFIAANGNNPEPWRKIMLERTHALAAALSCCAMATPRRRTRRNIRKKRSA